MTAPEKHDDLQSLKRFNDELVEIVEQLQKANQPLREELDLYRRKLFGQSSERHVEDDSQLHLFDVGEQTSEEEDDEPDPPEAPKRRRRKKKSEKLPSHLKRKVIEADVSREERMCSCCGEEMPIIGTDISERLDLVPAELFVWEIRRHKRACRTCKDGIAQVPAGAEPGGLTTPVPGSDYGFGVYTQIITNKFADHLPLYRGEDIFARAGLMIPRNTQFGMLANIAMLIAPLVELMKSRIVSGTVLGVDDTSVRMQDASLPGKMRTARFWLYRGREDHPYNVFDFTESRGRELAAAMYSLVSSAARHHLDVWASVDDCLRRLAGGSTDYASLLPDVWRSSHPEAIRPYRDIEQQSRRLTTQQRRVRRRAAKVA